MFEDLIFGDLLKEEPKCDCDQCENGDTGCGSSVQADVPAQTCWSAEEDLWSTKSEVFSTEDSPKIWSV